MISERTPTTNSAPAASTWSARLRSTVPPQARRPMVFAALAAFAWLYYYRPEDFIPGLTYIPMAKITGLFAFVALAVGMFSGGKFKIPKAVQYLWLLLFQMLMCVPFALWRGGAFSTVSDKFSKAVVVAMLISMTEMCRKQGVQRWADTTPEHILHLHRIKETIPDALIIHIIRDGRDVALSTDKLGYIHRLPWDRKPSKMVCGLYWDWMVNKGRRDGRDLGNDYTEVHFEELVSKPHETLARLGEFIGQELDYNRIREVGIGSVSAPNSSFGDGKKGDFNPAGRWRNGFPPDELEKLEGLIGRTLEENGYELSTKNRDVLNRPDLLRTRAMTGEPNQATWKRHPTSNCGPHHHLYW